MANSRVPLVQNDYLTVERKILLSEPFLQVVFQNYDLALMELQKTLETTLFQDTALHTVIGLLEEAEVINGSTPNLKEAVKLANEAHDVTLLDMHTFMWALNMMVKDERFADARKTHGSANVSVNAMGFFNFYEKKRVEHQVNPNEFNQFLDEHANEEKKQSMSFT